MQTKVLAGLVLVAIVAVGAYALMQQSEPAMVGSTKPVMDSMVETAQMEKPLMAEGTQGESIQAESTESQQALSNYVVYSPEAFAAATGKKRVLFFHASWCPTCKQANSDFEANAAQLPADVVVFKTDYDTYTDLKKQHGITYQHTFVEVDAAGQQLQKWNGGGVAQLSTKLQ